jgi:3D (Asp-Asp-Asp) domain-containing protein
MKGLISILCFAVLLSGSVGAHTGRYHRHLPFLATAFAQRGITRSGIRTQRGIVAADTRILPLGTTIQVNNAGPYSGTYTVADTGALVRGRHIDIFIPSRREALEFGRKMVEVVVLRWGEGA